MTNRERAQQLLGKAGITIDGSHPWDPQIKNDAVFDRIFSGGSLAVGESYMDGWWDVEDLAEMLTRIHRADIARDVMRIGILAHVLKAQLVNLQSKARAFQVGEEHYDIGNDLYAAMLDKRLTYTCGYWSGTPAATNLEEAQEAKLDLICRKVGLKAGDRVLDIGCGWGSFLIYAAETYGVTGVGLTVSKEQKELADKLVAEKGLSDRIEIRLQDYREVNDGPYDAIISIGMFEHVGHKNYRTYMEVARRVLKEDGLFLLHTIGTDRTPRAPEPWFHKYIFPNGILPSPRLMGAAFEGSFVLEDWHTFGHDYSRTLRAWWENFDRAWPELSAHYDERFYRMWKFYLLSMVATFQARTMNLWQIVLSPKGVIGGYRSVR